MAESITGGDVKNIVELEADVNVEFNEAASRQQINSGESVKTLFGKIRKFLTDLKAVAFSGAYSDLSGAPDLTQYALKSKYGDTTINVGRKADTVIGAYSTAEGRNATASGTYSHAEGNTTTASNAYCHAEGYRTTASGESSHAEGYNTTASKQYSHAEGCRTTASGESSHAEGYNTTASGISSHAEGDGTTASGNCSHAGGTGTKALHDNEVAYGRYNVSNADTVFSVGDGTSDSARHNAFEITTTGGKLHDKDIATTDMSLPANGGNADYAKDAGHATNADNADTLDNKHASDFANSYGDALTKFLNGQSGDIRTLMQQLPSGGYIFNTFMAEFSGISFPISGDGVLSWAACKHSDTGARYGMLIIRPMTSAGCTYICSVYNSTAYTEWELLYSDRTKPYVTGTLSEQASNSNVTMTFAIFDFTPSKVICQFGSGSAFFASVITNGFALTIPAGTTTIHYIAFK